MSWWDTSNLTSFAHQALKTAQKRIDKVLDIKEDESAPVIADTISSVADSPLKEFSEVKEPSVEPDHHHHHHIRFFNNWLGNESPATPRNQSITLENVKPTPISSSIQRKSKSDEKKKLSEFGESFSSDKLNISKPDSEQKVGRNRLAAKKSTDEVAKEPQSGLTVSLKSAFKHVKSDRNVEGLIAGESDNNELLKTEEPIGSAATSKVSVVNESNFRDDMFEDKFHEDISSRTHEEVIKDKVDEGIEPLTTSNICDSTNSVETRIEDSNKSLNAAGSLIKESEQVFVDKKSLFSCSNELEAVSNRNRESDFVAMTESTVSVDVTTGWTDASLSQMFTSSASIDCFDSLSQSDADREPQIVDESSPKDDIVMVKSMTIESINTEDQGSSDNLVAADKEFSSKANMLPTIGSGIDASVEIEDKKEDKIEDVVKFQIGSMVELVEVASLKEIPSLEGSLETASDDLSESNKTLTAEDSDISLSRDEVEFKDIKCNIEVCPETVEVENTELKESECVEVKGPLETGDAAVTADPVDSEVKAHAESELVVDTGSSEGPDRDSDKADSPRSCSSYVKNMLEEAMVESSSGNNGSSSDAVRVESGQTSGHTSADEIDMTTSSDIEIISQLSTPSFGIGWRSDKPCDLSPMKHGWGRPLQVRCSSPHGGHRRSDSGSSAQSLQSRNGDDFVSPDGTSGHRPSFDVRPKRNNGGENYPNVQLLQENSLLQKVGNESQEKKLAEMNEIIDAREKRQLELSQENIDLQETNSILRNQLKQLEEEREAEQEDIKEVTEEFTRRLAEAEKKFQAAIKEKDMYKKAMQGTELGKRTDNIEYEKVLKEKELTITELLAEGEKLSKQQLQANNHIKKLRSKEKENELAIKSFKTKIDEQKAEIERLEGILDVKVESEKTHVDAINQLNLAMKANKDEINRLKNDLEDAVEKARSFKVALDNSYKEMSELHKARVTDVSEAQKIALSNEVFIKEQLKQALEEHQLNSKRMQSDLITQIEDLQMSMCRMEKEHGRREDVLRQEISDLQQRLQEAEERNQELTQNVSAATRPLLRQIENLQSTYTVQSSSFERVEKNLTDRLTEAQNQLIAAVEKERMASEQLLDTSTRLTGLESQISSIRQDKARLQAELEMERAKVELLDETRHTEVAQKEATIQKLENDIREFKKEKILLENQLEMEKMKVETEKKKFVLIGDQLREKEMLLQTWSTKAMMSSSTDDHKSTASTPTPLQDDLTSDRLFSSGSILSGGRGPVFDNNRVSVYESLRQTSTSSLIESLQSQLKQRDGEIAQLQNDISELERTRESMARELVTLSLRNQDMEEKLRSLATFQKQYMELDQRYNALLQMYGEKVEEADELRLDLLDIKEMYKNQMDELLNRIPN